MMNEKKIERNSRGDWEQIGVKLTVGEAWQSPGFAIDDDN